VAMSNFFSNIGDIGNLANDLLQLEFTDASEDLVRFAFNSTFGIGGLIDRASPAGLPKHHQDFGLTLGRYGVPPGPYLVLPLFGPSSFRDATSWVFAYFLTPTTYLTAEVSVPLFGLDFVSAWADLLGATDILSQVALDQYTFVRSAYAQRRQYMRKSDACTAPPAQPSDLRPPRNNGCSSSGPAKSSIRPNTSSARCRLTRRSRNSCDLQNCAGALSANMRSSSRNSAWGTSRDAAGAVFITTRRCAYLGNCAVELLAGPPGCVHPRIAAA
jgi:phospholipid-binding lipoprotein MlaA